MMYSIVVPHFNNFDGLSKLLSTIPDRKDIEVIVVDDNSDIKKYLQVKDLIDESEMNISLFTNNTGFKGAGSARNIAVEKASGQYVIFADSDDYFTESAFYIIDEELFEKQFDIYFFKPTSKCLITNEMSDRHLPYSQLIDKYLVEGNEDIRYKFYVPWSKVYLREYIVDNGFKFDQVIASNDVMFSLTSATNARILASNETFYCVTRGIGTLTVNFSKEVLSSRLRVSLSESKYIYLNNIDVEKYSVYSIVRKSKFKINMKEFQDIFCFYLKGYIRLFPESYVGYMKNPKRILSRLFVKRSSIKDKRYRDR